MRKFFSTIALLASLGLSSMAEAQQATDVAGVSFPNTLQVADRTLQLNGAGIRYKVVFKVYAAGLYLEQKAATPEAVLADTGPLEIRVVMLRDISANELGKLFTKGMEQNAARSEFSRSIPGIVEMAEVFSTRRILKQGESFALQWHPGVGTVIVVNGKPAGSPIKEPEFYSALIKIWLGKFPADSQLKEALLGQHAGGGGNYNY